MVEGFGTKQFYAGLYDLWYDRDEGDSFELRQDYQDSIVMLLRAAHKAGCEIHMNIGYCHRNISRPVEEVYNSRELARLLTNVRTLKIEPPWFGSSSEDIDLQWYAFLLQHTSRLESLTVDISDGYEQDTEMVPASAWISQSLATTHLQEVSLSGMRHVSCCAIINLLANHKSTLRKVTIRASSLKNDSDWINICDWINENLNLSVVHLDNTLPMHEKLCSRLSHHSCTIVPVVQETMPLFGSALSSIAVLVKIAKVTREDLRSDEVNPEVPEFAQGLERAFRGLVNCRR